MIIIGFFIIEIFTRSIILIVRQKFQWLIISRDEHPKLSETYLKKFFIHGYDPLLGWVRKPNTFHEEKGEFEATKWTINGKGSRTNPGLENLESKISCYGDSFTFCRQVNDDETWEYFISLYRKTNVLNFGVGNYGIDQSLLRLKTEYKKNKTDIVILATVPDTISRIVSIWKHYYEYGNTFGFKPRFILKNDELKLINNPIDEFSKYSNYEKYLDNVRQYDFFYKNKFKKEIISFPYSLTVLKNFRRNLTIIYWVIKNLKTKKPITKEMEWKPMKEIMKINLKWRVKLFQDRDTVTLLKKIIEDYVSYSKQEKFKAYFIFLPQKDDILFIRKNFHFYQNFLDEIIDIYGLSVIDVTTDFLKEKDIDKLYSDKNEYGGHYSKKGNEKIASIIHNQLENF